MTKAMFIKRVQKLKSAYFIEDKNMIENMHKKLALAGAIGALCGQQYS